MIFIYCDNETGTNNDFIILLFFTCILEVYKSILNEFLLYGKKKVSQ